MRTPIRILIVLIGLAAATSLAAPVHAQNAQLQVGFGKYTITPVGPSPAGWGFIPQEDTGVWGEAFTDTNGNGCYDIAVPSTDFPPDFPPDPPEPEPHTDDPRNTLIDPLSLGKWDGVWTNAGFGGKCAQGKLDDIWARAVVFTSGGKTVAMASVDVVGIFQEEVDRVRAELVAKHPEIQLDAVIISATHAHEGPDTMGLWHGTIGLDGKYPLFQQFIRSRLVQAIVSAYNARETAWVKFARGTETNGLRDSRPPIVFDPDVWTAQFVRPGNGSTIGTLVNWSNHPEALGGNNNKISSDFPGGVRSRMESALGGTAIYFSGSVGGLMTPLGVTNVPGFPTDDRSHARAIALGTMIANAALSALGPADFATSTAIDVAHKDFIIPLENLSLVALNTAGVFDRELETLEGQTGVLTEMYAVHLGPAVFITVPGELFPEIANGGYGREHVPQQNGDCPEADTGRPYEPVIRDQFTSATYKFLFGLGQDELGYIVPKYDFWAFGFPPSGEIYEEAGAPAPPLDDPEPRPPLFVGVLERKDPCDESHYEETVSAASTMAPIVACTAAELAGHDPFGTWDTDPENRFEACSPDNTTTLPGGIVPPPVPLPF